MNIQAAELRRFSNSCLVKAGVPEQEAQTITDTMVEADAKGIHSHGLMRLPIYVERFRRGLMLPAAHITVQREQGATAVLDGHGSAGQIVATKAMELAMDKAKRHGIGAVLAKNSNHFGIAAHYALKAARRDMIGVVLSNTAPLMPPTGGAEKVLGNNPLAIAAPTSGEFPLLLDMALSQAALGKIIHAQTRGVPIPEGWGADSSGRPTADPSAVLNGGFILPVGGPKGFGLALMIELMTGVLADSQFSKTIPSMYDLTQQQAISHLMLAIDVASFIEASRFQSLGDVLVSYVKQATRAEGVTELYAPGEIEFRLERKRLKEGIPLDEGVLRQLRGLASSLGVPAIQKTEPFH